MPRKTGRAFTVQVPDLANFKGKTLRAFLEELIRWLRQWTAAMSEPPGRIDRHWAITAGTITANAGTSGPLGHGNVVRLKRMDDRTLDDIGDGEEIEVDNAVLSTIPDGSLVLVEIVDGVPTITALVDCP